MGKIIGLVILVAAVWHFKVAKTDGVRITGLFKEEPEFGYAWKGSHENGPRNFWNKTEVSWTPGLKHPQYNVQAGLQPNNWVPLPGYNFTNNEPGNFETSWQAGLVHPNCKAWSATQEGYWISMPGYRFTRNIAGEIDGTEWEPGIASQGHKEMIGDNIVSDKLMSKSTSSGLKALVND